MKVAVCISGACRTKREDWSPARCVATIKSKFPDADFYYATWDSHRPIFENLFPDEKCEYFSEPVMHYNPYVDIDIDYQTLDSPNQNRYQRRANKFGAKDFARNSTKQILIHTWLSDKIKSNYDVIVRARFDVAVYSGANFTEYLHDTVNTNSTHGFYTSPINTFETLKHVSQRCSLVDNLIIHSPDAINANHVNTLHTNKQLHGSEVGWHQVINLSHKPCKTFTNHHGWVIAVHMIRTLRYSVPEEIADPKKEQL